jgi:hypothetical protein
MSRPTRADAAGRAWLDLRNRARREGRGTQELLVLYVVERWLARLAASPYAETFVLKGGMLLAAYDARRPTADADTLARGLRADETTVAERVIAVAEQRPEVDDGVRFRTETTTARPIREQATYPGVRISMDSNLASAAVKFRLDVNFGDPVRPAARRVMLPALRPDGKPIRLLGYPIETVLAEKIATALTLGAANSRVRDYGDVYTLTAGHRVSHRAARKALLATVGFRGGRLTALSQVIGGLGKLRQNSYAAYRATLGPNGADLPEAFADLVFAVTAFADPLVEPAPANTVWLPSTRRWTRVDPGQQRGR